MVEVVWGTEVVMPECLRGVSGIQSLWIPARSARE
jgi:hypothetical protein